MTEPNDPFARVPAPLRTALEKRGFAQLTAVQTAVLAKLEGDADGEVQNLRISSQTGSGKTVALGIALSRTLLAAAEDAPGPLALIITPTRELAAQVQGELAWLFEACPGVSVDVVTGGTDVRREQRRLRERAKVLVGTPGRLLDHMRSGALDPSTVRAVVLDEADQMLDMGFKDELDAIVDQLPAERRSHLVSATFPPEVRALAQRFQGEALSVEGTALGAANQDIEHIAYLVRPSQRYAAVVNLLLENHGERCLIFVRTRADTSELCEALAGDGFGALPFSGELPQAQRTRTLDAFRRGTIHILVATDVAARGIDVPDIATVIHADIPGEPDVYTHRSGRTGRAGKTGKSLIIVPVNAQARMQRVLRSARIEARWEPVPSPKKIKQSVTKATRRTLYELLDKAELSEAELTYAQNVLEKQPPARVIATLLRMAERALPCEPLEVTPAEPRAREPRAGVSAPRGGREGAHSPGYVRFSMSWGARNGATASRCMSHVCRRGGITRHDVGAIDVQDDRTTLEVSEAVAADFEKACRAPDPRDPFVSIVRDGAPRHRALPKMRGERSVRPARSRAGGEDVHASARVERSARRSRPSARPPQP